MNDSHDMHDPLDDTLDPIALLRERERANVEQKKLEAREQAAQVAANDQLIPEMINRFLEGLSELHKLYLEADHPQLDDASLIMVVNHDKPSREDGTPTRSWLYRLTHPSYTNLVYKPGTKEVAVWPASRLYLKNGPYVNVTLEVNTGQVYCTSFKGSVLTAQRVDILDESELKELTYSDVATLLDNLKHQTESVRYKIGQRERKLMSAAPANPSNKKDRL